MIPKYTKTLSIIKFLSLKLISLTQILKNRFQLRKNLIEAKREFLLSKLQSAFSILLCILELTNTLKTSRRSSLISQKKMGEDIVTSNSNDSVLLPLKITLCLLQITGCNVNYELFEIKFLFKKCVVVKIKSFVKMRTKRNAQKKKLEFYVNCVHKINGKHSVTSIANHLFLINFQISIFLLLFTYKRKA